MKDGSELAECALDHVKKLSKDGSLGEVVLLNVFLVTLPLNAPDFYQSIIDIDALTNDYVNKSLILPAALFFCC